MLQGDRTPRSMECGLLVAWAGHWQPHAACTPDRTQQQAGHPPCYEQGVPMLQRGRTPRSMGGCPDRTVPMHQPTYKGTPNLQVERGPGSVWACPGIVELGPLRIRVLAPIIFDLFRTYLGPWLGKNHEK